MRFLPFCVLLAALTSLTFVPADSAECGGEVECEVGDRGYHALPPPNWDGVEPLPVLLHFHGWRRHGTTVIRNRRISEPAGRNGLLVLAPNGLRGSWDFWGDESQDADFVDAVLADAAQRWPIDPKRVFISGFSYGGAMAWRLACLRGSDFAGYLPIAGGLRRQGDITCSGPARLAHVHGLKDTVYGLPIGYGDPVEDGVELWRRTNRTQAEPQQRFDHARYDCRIWEGQQPVTLCTHEGGHFIPKDWLDWILPQMLADS